MEPRDTEDMDIKEREVTTVQICFIKDVKITLRVILG
jgi:hypothetical protein